MPRTVHDSDILLSECDESGILRLTLNDVGRRNTHFDGSLSLFDGRSRFYGSGIGYTGPNDPMEDWVEDFSIAAKKSGWVVS